jgi:hypothetical protein
MCMGRGCAQHVHAWRPRERGRRVQRWVGTAWTCTTWACTAWTYQAWPRIRHDFCSEVKLLVFDALLRKKTPRFSFLYMSLNPSPQIKWWRPIINLEQPCPVGFQSRETLPLITLTRQDEPTRWVFFTVTRQGAVGLQSQFTSTSKARRAHKVGF